MTEMSGVDDSSAFYGNTILVGIEDFGYNEYVFISGFEFIKFITDDQFIDFVSLMGNNMIPTVRAVGGEYS